jgi:hypothetical protein
MGRRAGFLLFALWTVALGSGLVLAADAAFWPQPEIVCDAGDILTAERLHAAELGQWLLARALGVAAAAGLLAYGAFSFQVAHGLLGGLGGLGSVLRAAAVWLAALLSGTVLLQLAWRWEPARDGSCLAEALRDPHAAYHAAYSSRLFELSWWVGAHLDLAACTLAATVAGVLSYLGARKIWSL